MIKELIEQDIKRYAAIGHPAVLERFVLRNGRAFEPTPIDECDRMERRLCFGNAFQTMYWGADPRPYVEGLAWHPGLPMLIHHAWNAVDGKAYDVTWPAYPGAEYWGVEFDDGQCFVEQEKSGYYCMLDNGHGFNLDLMFRIDPELREIVDNIRKAA